MESITKIEETCQAAIAAATTIAELRQIEVQYVGRSGELTGLLRSVGSLPESERPLFGKAVNEAKARLQLLLDERHAVLKLSEDAQSFATSAIDTSLPGRRFPMGLPHVLNQTAERIKKAFFGLGFEYYEGPELETMQHNFLDLNYPPDHPAMDDQDTFYVDDNRLMRTQCTSFQGRLLKDHKPPLRFFTIGRCFRNEAVDRTHGHTFHQVDAFMIDKGVSMAHLKGTLGAFARAMFGQDVNVRFRPDYFPFVEPGVDYSISNPFRRKDGTGPEWLELGGAGLVHANILENFAIDPDEYSGFAFGLGVERIAMLQYGIDDLRLFMENDLRFLEQFPA